MINFNKFYKLFNLISLCLVIVSVLLLFFKGLNFGVDFKGGTLIELRSNDKSVNVASNKVKIPTKKNKLISSVMLAIKPNILYLHLLDSYYQKIFLI